MKYLLLILLSALIAGASEYRFSAHFAKAQASEGMLPVVIHDTVFYYDPEPAIRSTDLKSCIIRPGTVVRTSKGDLGGYDITLDFKIGRLWQIQEVLRDKRADYGLLIFLDGNPVTLWPRFGLDEKDRNAPLGNPFYLGISEASYIKLQKPNQ